MSNPFTDLTYSIFEKLRREAIRKGNLLDANDYIGQPNEADFLADNKNLSSFIDIHNWNAQAYKSNNDSHGLINLEPYDTDSPSYIFGGEEKFYKAFFIDPICRILLYLFH